VSTERTGIAAEICVVGVDFEARDFDDMIGTLELRDDLGDLWI
jgi:hypothetical protein